MGPVWLALGWCVMAAVGLQPGLPPARTGRELAPCQACRVFANSFSSAMEHTARSMHAGGDAAWEEQRLGSYARSEVRLVEVQERLCHDVEGHRDRCHAVGELAEPYVEEWWQDRPDGEDDIFNWLCVDKLQHCCPPHHYGQNCSPCRGGVDNPCGGNGKCKGDGTRKGNGECSCDSGYTGETCQSCVTGFYQSYKDDKKLLCSPCHKACKGDCTNGGITGCSECAKGWTMYPKEGCLDINECDDKSTCEKNHFCVNGEGSFKCLKCDKSCDECTGDGPDMCVRCGTGYQLKGELCVDSGNVEMSRRVTLTRYVTYFGLCLTICIIFQKSTLLAGVLGLLVALYISVSEYMLANDLAGPNPMIDPNSIDLAKLLGGGGS